jgi:predicted small secreted protein
MIRSRGLVALAAVAALSLSACTNNDADAGDVVDAMTDAGLDEDQARCMGDEFEREFGDDQDVFNDLAAADDPQDFPSGTQETVDSIIEECTGESVPGSGGSESEGQDGDSETTTTTEAEGN